MYIFLNFNVYFKFYAFFIVILHKYRKIFHNIKKVYCNFIQIKEVKTLRESQKKAIDKYITKVKPLNIRIDNTIYNMLVEYCKEKGYSKKEFIERAIQAYIDNN